MIGDSICILFRFFQREREKEKKEREKREILVIHAHNADTY